MSVHRSRLAGCWRTAGLILGLALSGGAIGGSDAVAQSAVPSRPADNAQPIEIEADQGIEWLRNDQRVTARGNARAVRGQLDVRADELIALYRERPDGTAEVWRLDANGNVRITSQSEKAFSDHATYDLDKDRLLLTGKRPRVVTGDGEISADGQIQYRAGDRVLVATGNAEAKQPDRDIRADVLTIFLRDGAQNQSRLSRIEAEKDVVVVTAKETIVADKGLYEDDSGLATFTGAVKVTNDGNTLAGCRGEINLRTGVSRMTGCGAPGSPDSRVRGVIVPGGSRTN